MSSMMHLSPWLAACAYGSWAGYSNFESQSLSVWMMAALIQAGFAFVATLLLTRLVLLLSQWRHSRLNPYQVYGYCSLILISAPTLLHFLAGTPYVLQSILPGALIGHGYLVYLVFYADHEMPPSA
ncbi:MAG: hypothetical protein ACRBBW_11585 [Cellvibrionaceae bacterium]